MTHLSLFSGIGGIDLAAEWAGFETVAFVERDKFCQKVLAKHWPEVPIYDDITTFDAEPFRGVDLVSGGFPCQDISVAGKQKGLTGERSGLFHEMARVVSECKPKYALLENVAALRFRGLATVIRVLARIGYCCEWGVSKARSAGAPHERKRLFLIAYPYCINGSARVRHVSIRQMQNVHDNGGICASAFWDKPYSGVLGMGNGTPKGLDADRIRALGNAVVPQQAYPILEAIAKELQLR